MKVLVTGGTSGIGKEVVLALGAKGCHVDVVGGTNEQKGRLLREAFESTPGTLRFYPVDLSEPATIRDFATRYLQENESLDVLFANAGFYVTKPALGACGLERGFVVNYLHKFMMMVMLHPLLARSSGQTVINGSANFARTLDLRPEVFAKSYRKNMDGMMQATYANAYLTYWFNRSFSNSVALQSVNPGFVKTSMMSNAGLLIRGLQSLFGTTPQKAARNIAPVLLGETFQGEKGTYIDQGKRKDFRGKLRQDQDTFRKLWKQSLDLSGLEAPEGLREMGKAS